MKHLSFKLTKLLVLGVKQQVFEVKKPKFDIHFKKYALIYKGFLNESETKV